MNGRTNENLEKKYRKSLHLKNCSIKKAGIIYPYYAIAESHLKNGKNQKKIIKYLGPLNADQIESYRAMLTAINNGDTSMVSLQGIELSDTRDFLNVFTLHSIWEELGLTHVFPDNEKKGISTGTVAEILTLSKLVQPSCATKTVDWLRGTHLPCLLGIDLEKYNRMKIFNELELISQCQEKIEQRLIKLSQDFSKGEIKIFYVDGTTTFFEGTHCDLAKPGEDKTTGYRSHTILILLVTDAKGFPCAWDVCMGNEREIVKFQSLAIRLCDKYNIRNFTFCFDRGFASFKNFETLAKFSSQFISGLDKNQISKVFDVETFQKTKSLLLDKFESQDMDRAHDKKRFPINGFYTSNGERYFKDLGVVGEYRYVAGFSCEIYFAEKSKRENQQIKAIHEIEDLNIELSHAKGDRDFDVVEKTVEAILVKNKMKGLIKFTVVPKAIKIKKDQTIQSAKITVQVDLEEFTKTGFLDGIFVYITDHTEKKDGRFIVSAHEIVEHYRNKYVIEKDFRDLKNSLEIRPLYVRLEEHVKALVSISVIAQFIKIYIEQKLKSLELSSEKFMDLINSVSATAKITSGQKSVIKHKPLTPEVSKALLLLGVSDAHRLKIAATLT